MQSAEARVRAALLAGSRICGMLRTGHVLPARHGCPGGTASFEGGSQQRTLILHLSGSNADDRTPEEGFHVPGQAQLFSFTHH